MECNIPLSAETTENSHQASVFLLDAVPNELDDRDVVPRLAPRTYTITEHESICGRSGAAGNLGPTWVQLLPN
jgi:hypothetical protein